ncbi:MAG: hypothetical protein ACOY90_01590 [Candidatus Zhuqueibacterota bacterium]
MESVLNYVVQVGLISSKLLLGLFFPIVFSCFILNLLAKEQNRRLYYIGGWKALLATAWIGTPIHELSHYLAAVVASHKVVEIQLFKPDKHTGSMGYVTHSFQSDNFYQAVIGNTFIAIAPFFGGAGVIYLISTLVFPDFSLFTRDVPQIYYLTLDNALQWKSYLMFGQSAYYFFDHLFDTMFAPAMLGDWKLYVFLFLMLGIANHLSPSGSDFKYFWTPLLIFVFTIFLLNLIIYPLVREPEAIITTASRYVFVFLPILYLSIFISALGLLVTFILSMIVWVFKR